MVGISKAAKAEIDASFYHCISGLDGDDDHEFCFEFPASGGKSRLYISYERNRVNVDSLENSLFDCDFMETWERLPILLAKHLPTLPDDGPSFHAFQLVNSSFQSCEAPKININGHQNYPNFQAQDLEHIRELGSKTNVRLASFAANQDGWTEGFSDPILDGCQVFSMGKTVLELFTKDHPEEGTVQEDIKVQFEGLIGEMIWMCCKSLEDIPSAREVKEQLLPLAAKEHLLAQ
ncbi:hypothetical protein H072_8403 [Dactylellina haptotyla CBS 200.50]|uniref:Uncharacterized protein n=1 Tax=Dactylellina haptotyla (strain CBS 200.50) TaxID=1284197 RepID=S8A9Q0_DACHA|nr:hypothetical protein H072_8403 [Dactylellina haptotyla CBS 200.50]